MRKTIISLTLLFLSLNLFATEKDIVYVERFTYTQGIGESQVLALRNKIIEGLMKPDRLTIKDVNSESSLKDHELKITEDASKVDGSTLTQMKALHARYLIKGHVQTIEAKKSVSESGTVSYDGSIAFSLQIIEVETGTLTTTETYNYSGLIGGGGTGGTTDEAFNHTMRAIENDMKVFIDKHFELTGTILEISKENKGKAQEVYINLGSKHGVQKGQKFEIFIAREIAGRVAHNKVGELQAESVEAADLTRCKVNGGPTQEAVKKAVGEGTEIVIKSIFKTNVGDKLKNVGGGLFGL